MKDITTIPEFFYDLILYLSSGIYFLLGIGILFPELFVYINSLKISTSWMAFVCFIISNIFGQLFSTFSAILIRDPLRILVRKYFKTSLFVFDNNSDNVALGPKIGTHWKEVFEIQKKSLEVYNILIKRYARLKLSRSLSVVNLLLIIIYLQGVFCEYIPSVNYLILTIFMLLLVLFTIDYYYRQCWFNQYLQNYNSTY